MNDSFSNSSSEVAALRSQVFTLFLALIVVSGTVTSYLYYQSRQLSKQLTVAEQTIDNLKKNEANINGFIGQLIDYSKRDPNYLAVLKKYGLPPQAAPKK